MHSWEAPLAEEKNELEAARGEALQQVQRLQIMLDEKKDRQSDGIKNLAELKSEFLDLKKEAVTFINERILVNFSEQLHSERRERDISAQIAKLEVCKRLICGMYMLCWHFISLSS
jgi:hypothetical protein